MNSIKLLIVLISIIVITSNPTQADTENKHSHVFLIKTDLTKEKVEELLKKVEANVNQGNQFKQIEAVEVKKEDNLSQFKKEEPNTVTLAQKQGAKDQKVEEVAVKFLLQKA